MIWGPRPVWTTPGWTQYLMDFDGSCQWLPMTLSVDNLRVDTSAFQSSRQLPGEEDVGQLGLAVGLAGSVLPVAGLSIIRILPIDGPVLVQHWSQGNDSGIRRSPDPLWQVINYSLRLNEVIDYLNSSGINSCVMAKWAKWFVPQWSSWPSAVRRSGDHWIPALLMSIWILCSDSRTFVVKSRTLLKLDMSQCWTMMSPLVSPRISTATS